MATMIEASGTDTAPSPEMLMARARAFSPGIAARIPEADRIRDIPIETIRDLRDAELFRVFQPAAWGGFEMDQRVFFDVQNIDAEAWASTAWVYGVLSVHSLVLALFSQIGRASCRERVCQNV